MDGLWTAGHRRPKFGDKWYCVSSGIAADTEVVPKGQAIPDHMTSVVGSGTGFGGFGHRSRTPVPSGRFVCPDRTLVTRGAYLLHDRQWSAHDRSDPDQARRLRGSRTSASRMTARRSSSSRRAAAAARAILFLHWFDTEAPDGDRTQFLAEAESLARDHGVVSILPQGQFPWAGEPTDAEADASRIRAEVERHRAALDMLAARADVDAARIALVGHDFGAMHGTILAADDPRIAAAVLIAATPRWGDWFLPFWPIAGDRHDYLRALSPARPDQPRRRPRAAPGLLPVRAQRLLHRVDDRARVPRRRGRPEGAARVRGRPRHACPGGCPGSARLPRDAPGPG